MAARANGWTAETEVTGITQSGEQWTADVLAQKEGHKVAVEIQWSSQANNETLRRQERYKESGVRGLWLIRQPGFPIGRELPAACIGGTLERGFSALIPRSPGMSAHDRDYPDRWHQNIPMKVLLDAAFSKQLRFGVPLNIDATVSVQGAFRRCWHSSCPARTRILTSIDVAFGPYEYCFSIAELGEHPGLLGNVLNQLPSNIEIGKIKPRFSKTKGRSYMSNGCIRCDRLFGEFFEVDARCEQESLHTFPIRISQQWQHAIENHYAYQESWSVYLRVG